MTIPSPILHWNFAGANGNTVKDLVRSAPMTIHANASFVTVDSRAGLRFGPGDAHVTTTEAGPLNGAWTVSLWVRREAATSGAALFSGPRSALKLEQWDSPNKVGFTKYSYGVISAGFDEHLGDPVPLSQWVSLIFVSTGTETRLYANGRRTNSAKAIPLELGWVGSTRNVVEWAQMVLGEVKIWDVALDDDQVARLTGPELLVTEGSQVIANGASASMGAANIGGESTSKTFTVTNTGEEVLKIASVGLDNNTDYTLSPSPLAKDLRKGETLTFTVTFSPKSVTQSAARVTIASNAPGGAHWFTLSGTGVAAPAPKPTAVLEWAWAPAPWRPFQDGQTYDFGPHDRSMIDPNYPGMVSRDPRAWVLLVRNLGPVELRVIVNIDEGFPTFKTMSRGLYLDELIVPPGARGGFQSCIIFRPDPNGRRGQYTARLSITSPDPSIGRMTAILVADYTG